MIRLSSAVVISIFLILIGIIYLCLCCSTNGVFNSSNPVVNVISKYQGTPVLIESNGGYLSYNPQTEGFILSKRKNFFNMDPISNNEVYLSFEMKDTQYYLCINYNEVYSSNYSIGIKPTKANSCGLKLYKSKSKGYFIKFYNGYYLCYDEETFTCSKDHSIVFYFEIIRI